MQHSPSRATNPESLRVNCDFKSRERLGEDIRGHIFCGTVLDVDFVVGNGLANKMESNVDMFCSCMVVVVGGELEHCLVVAEEGSGGGRGAE
jgi:hypothetical protein